MSNHHYIDIYLIQFIFFFSDRFRGKRQNGSYGC